MSPRSKWLVTGGTGASLFGFGLCAVVESGFLKHSGSGSDWWLWMGLGTLSLIMTIFGLVLLIKAGLMEKELH